MLIEMLRRGVDRVHLRHPGCDIEPILREIPQELHRFISLHDRFELAGECGVHLNGRNPKPPKDFKGIISKTCHSVAEITPRFNYVTLSPIFPSISKPGYGTGFAEEELMKIPSDYVIALGGINHERIDTIKRYPFKGVALLGSIWQSDDPIKEIEKYVYSLK